MTIDMDPEKCPIGFLGLHNWKYSKYVDSFGNELQERICKHKHCGKHQKEEAVLGDSDRAWFTVNQKLATKEVNQDE